MKYSIISTYPIHGSQNIGDALIANSTINLIKNIKGSDHEFQIIWRGSNWEDIKDDIIESNAIIFACLAIRKNMHNVYPFLSKILKLNIPIGVLSAGTSLNMNTNSKNIYTDFLNKDIQILNELNKKAIFFTTRGFLTQSFCTYYGLDNVTFSGDIAFWDKRFLNRKFTGSPHIKNIAISDPHYGKSYLQSFKLLCEYLQKTFKEANITVLLHSVNPYIENFCEQENVKTKKIYLNKDNGLDVYDSFDLHVGYRVHGHVSALCRRVPSYLIEQDGRGCDYGLTLEKKISVSGFNNRSNYSIISILQEIIFHKSKVSMFIELNPIYQIFSLIENDLEYNFERFKTLETQILLFNTLCSDAINKLP